MKVNAILHSKRLICNEMTFRLCRCTEDDDIVLETSSLNNKVSTVIIVFYWRFIGVLVVQVLLISSEKETLKRFKINSNSSYYSYRNADTRDHEVSTNLFTSGIWHHLWLTTHICVSKRYRIAISEQFYSKYGVMVQF